MRRLLLALGLLLAGLGYAQAQAPLISFYPATALPLGTVYPRTTTTGGAMGLGNATIFSSVNITGPVTLIEARVLDGFNASRLLTQWSNAMMTGSGTAANKTPIKSGGHYFTVPASNRPVFIEMRANGDNSTIVRSNLIYSGLPIDSVETFRDSQGVNFSPTTAASTGCSVAYYCDYTDLAAGLNYLKINNVRLRADGNSLQGLQSLIAIMPNLHVTAFSQCTTAATSFLTAIQANLVMATGGNEVQAVNQSNECITNGYGGYTLNAAEIQFQKDWYAAVKAVLPNIPVCTPSLTIASGAQTLYTWAGDLSGYSDCVDAHPYTRNISPAYSTGGVAAQQQQALAPKRVIYETEQGFSSCNASCTNGATGMTEEMQAMDGIFLFLDQKFFGVQRTFHYKLDNQSSALNDYQSNFGMFLYQATAAAATPKMIATAVHNMNTFMADSGTPPVNQLNQPFTLTENGGAPNQFTYTRQFAHSNGCYFTAVWNEPQNVGAWYWDNTNFQVKTISDVTTVFTLPGSHTFTVYDPITGTTIVTVSAAASVTFARNVHPLFVKAC